MKKCSTLTCPNRDNRDNAKICHGCGWQFPTAKDTRNNRILCWLLAIGAILSIIALFLPVVKITTFGCFLIFCSPISTQEVGEWQLAAVYLIGLANAHAGSGYSPQYAVSPSMFAIAQLYAPNVWATVTMAFTVIIYAGLRMKSPLPMIQITPMLNAAKPKKKPWGYAIAFFGVFIKIITLLQGLQVASNMSNIPGMSVESGYIGSGTILSLAATFLLVLGLIMIKVEENQRKAF